MKRSITASMVFFFLRSSSGGTVDLVQRAVDARALVAARAVVRISPAACSPLRSATTGASSIQRGQPVFASLASASTTVIDHLLTVCASSGSRGPGSAGCRPARTAGAGSRDLGDGADGQARVVRSILFDEIAGDRPSMWSTSGFSITSGTAGRRPTAIRRSGAGLGIDGVEGQRALAEPDRPVITISRSRGRSRSKFFRLWVRAPRMRMVSIAIGEGWPGRGTARGGGQQVGVTSPRFGAANAARAKRGQGGRGGCRQRFDPSPGKAERGWDEAVNRAPSSGPCGATRPAWGAGDGCLPNLHPNPLTIPLLSALDGIQVRPTHNYRTERLHHVRSLVTGSKPPRDAGRNAPASRNSKPMPAARSPSTMS